MTGRREKKVGAGSVRGQRAAATGKAKSAAAGKPDTSIIAHDLGERVKEVRCLYGLARLIEESDGSLQQIFRGLVEIIPSAWQYPEITGARLQAGGSTYASPNWRQ